MPAEDPIPQPYHRWAVNEDPAAPNAYQTSTGRPDHCLTCGVVRWALLAWVQELAAGPCPGPYHRRTTIAPDD
jgi:hypothetical protein